MNVLEMKCLTDMGGDMDIERNEEVHKRVGIEMEFSSRVAGLGMYVEWVHHIAKMSDEINRK